MLNTAQGYLRGSVNLGFQQHLAGMPLTANFRQVTPEAVAKSTSRTANR
jgi:hypothetical protein